MNEPFLYNPHPSNNDSNVNICPMLSIDVSDPQSNLIDVIFSSNASGSWEIIRANYSVGNGSYICRNTSRMNNFNTKY